MSTGPRLVVIDTGSYTTKAGIAEDNAPKGIIPTLVGGDTQKTTSRCPLEDGVIAHWDDVEKLWSHVFTDVLSVDPTTCNVLLTDSTTNTLANREKMAQVMFEKFNIKSLYIAKQSVLGLYSTGRLTGLVVDSGHVSTHVVPVYEGYCVSDAIERIPIGGRNVTDHLINSLQAKGATFSSNPFNDATKIKESMVKVADDFDGQVKSCTSQDYFLPDGKKISIGKESLEAAELLFRPQLADAKSEQQALPKVIQASIMKCEIDARKDLRAAITLIGGNTMTAGFPDRVVKEMSALHAGNTKIISRPERTLQSWIGGSLLAALPQTDWVTRQQYADTGAGAIKKCP